MAKRNLSTWSVHGRLWVWCALLLYEKKSIFFLLFSAALKKPDYVASLIYLIQQQQMPHIHFFSLQISWRINVKYKIFLERKCCEKQETVHLPYF